MADEFKRDLDRCGPGGVKCHCCGSAPGKGKDVMRRNTRRRLKQKVREEIKDEEK